MTTCAKCGGALTEHHRCTGLWRLRSRAWGAILAGAVIGGIVGWLLLVEAYGQASWLAVAFATSIGAFIVMALQRG